METRAPAVVAVVVTTGPGPGLEATLASLVVQDYEELSLLVVANGPAEHVAARVAAVAPHAFVRVLEENTGFATACNEAAVMVQGSAFLLLCHDDVRLDPDCVHLLVEAAFRTNAAIVSPKYVDYEDELVLLHVGQTCDRFGVVRDRIDPGEIDHGQQDLERDVFVAPGGVTLVRTDLFATLRGFDPLIPVLGEDLDLCWRAQAAGARIIVAPQARVAHRETIATSERAITALGTRRASRQDLIRRHQLLVVATGWGLWRTVSTLLWLALMDLMELVLAIVGRDTDRIGAILGSWRWLAWHRKRVVERRRARRVTQVLSDDELSRLQVGGASRLQRFFLVLVRDGLDHARGILPEPLSEAEPLDEVHASVGFAAAFSEDEEFDDVTALVERKARPSRILTSFRSQVVVLVVAALCWLLGSRDLVATHLPLVGQLAPLDSWWSTWRHFFATWSPNGVGTRAPGMPGYGLLGFFGTFVLGRMGILPRLAMIASVPFGALGMARLLKGRVSNRARVVASVAYLGLPTGLNMISQGRLNVLVCVAAMPFVLRRLFELMAVPSFRSAPYPDPVAFGQRGWRVTEAGQRLSLIMIVATVGAFDPAMLIAVSLVVVGVWLARRFEPDAATPSSTWRLLGAVWFNVAIFLLPLSVDVVLAGRRGVEVFGLPRGPWTAPSLSDLLRGVDGTFGAGWWGWLIPLVSVLALVLSRGERRSLMTKVVAIELLTLALITLSDHHWLGSFAPDIDVLFALYAALLAVAVGVGISALEIDLRAANFGWRQIAAGVAVAALVGSIVPFFVSLGSGRFDLPTSSVAESLSALSPPTSGGFRVLWLGDPSVLPVPGWTVAPGLAAATSTDGLPGGNVLFSPPVSGTSDVIMNAVSLALNGQTVELGHLLATSAISAIVVMNAASPQLSGVESSPVRSVPAQLLPSLSAQTDLSLELKTSSVEVFANAAFPGLVNETNPTSGATVPLFSPSTNEGPLVSGWRHVTASLAPADLFDLDVNGVSAPRSVVNGFEARFTVPASASAATAELRLAAFPWNGILAGFTLFLWLVVWLGFGWIQRLEWLFTGRRQPKRSRRG